MRKTTFLLYITAVLFFCNGCAAIYKAEVKPPTGIVFSAFKAPLTANFEHTPNDQNLLRTSFKKTQYFYEPLLTNLSFGWGDSDIALIAQKAGINKVAYADYEFLNIFGIYAELQINIYGYE